MVHHVDIPNFLTEKVKIRDWTCLSKIINQLRCSDYRIDPKHVFMKTVKIKPLGVEPACVTLEFTRSRFFWMIFEFYLCAAVFPQKNKKFMSGPHFFFHEHLSVNHYCPPFFNCYFSSKRTYKPIENFSCEYL